jgi:hypothetical protein
MCKDAEWANVELETLRGEQGNKISNGVPGRLTGCSGCLEREAICAMLTI